MDSTIRLVYGDYRRSASKRGYAFQLELPEFKEMIRKACHYCGGNPSTIYNQYLKKDGSSKKLMDGIRDKDYAKELTLIYNGIDRVNNTKGYSSENCVPCCEVCNRAKRDMPTENFLAWIERLRGSK